MRSSGYRFARGNGRCLIAYVPRRIEANAIESYTTIGGDFTTIAVGYNYAWTRD